MRLMQDDLLKTISNSAPGALVEQLNVIGPHAPSWKRGLRSIRGLKGQETPTASIHPQNFLKRGAFIP